jgi:hypothetical protein
VRGETVLIGGDASPGIYASDSVWTWTGAGWHAVPAEGPGWRTLPAAAFDATRGRIVLQGGRRILDHHRYADAAEADTWAWDGTRWARLETDGPGAHDHHAMAYDAAHDKVVLQGGADGSSILPGETWGFDGTRWSLLADAANGPGPRVHHAMAYDGGRERVVLYGGFGPQRDEASEAETWAWDGTRWERVATTGPGPRARHRMAYDATAGLVILFGGGDDPRTGGWDGMTWRVLAEEGPPALEMHAMAWDAGRGRVVLFGGGAEPGADLWEWDGERWQRIGASPE